MTEEKNRLDPEELISLRYAEYKIFYDAIDGIPDPKSLQEAESALQKVRELRISSLGKKSKVAALRKRIREVVLERRDQAGSNFQELDRHTVQQLDDKERTLEKFIDAARTERDRLDVTIPGRRPRPGHLHPITLMRQR